MVPRRPGHCTIRLRSSNAVALARALKAVHPDFLGKKVGEALEVARAHGPSGIEFSLTIRKGDAALAVLALQHPEVEAIRTHEEPEEPEPEIRPRLPNRFNPDQRIPSEILDQFPNWEYALDEVSEEGQDESTIRPATDQSSILPMHTHLTAGDATFADFTVIPVLIVGFLFDGTIEDIQAVRPIDAERSASWLSLVGGAVRMERSREFIETWGDRFPMRVESRLRGPHGKIRFRLNPSASEIVADGV